jgi:hypothetical protein
MKIQLLDTIHSNNDPALESLFEILKLAEIDVDKSNTYSSGYDLYITNGDVSTQIKEKLNVPVIYYITSNPYVHDIESFVYNKTNCYNWLHNTSIITTLWIQSQYEEYRDYLEVIYKLPVYIVPFTYNISQPIANIQKTSNMKTVDIILYETNDTFNSSSLKALYICEEYYRRYPEKLGTVYLINMPENETAYKLKDALMISKDKKLRVFNNLKNHDILTFFKQNTNRTVFLSNSNLNHVTQFMYDIVYNNMLLLHTQKKFPFGVYYDVLDTETCLQLLNNDTLQNKVFGAAEVESYIKQIVDDYKKVLSYVVGLKSTQSKINIHEQSCTDTNDLAKPLVITYDNEPNENTQFYIQTLKTNKWDYILIGKGETWGGWTTRMNAYLNILKTLPPNKIVILTYARDVICCRSSSAFMDAYRSFSSDMVVCMELMCDNSFDKPADYIGLQCHPIKKYWKFHSIASPPSRKYVNNGLVAGKVHKLIEMIQYGIDNKYTDDQFALGSFINNHPAAVGVDTEMELFHTSCFGAYAGMLDINLQKTDSPTFAELFGRAAFFLHIPGTIHINGSKLIYKTVKALIDSGIHDTLFRTGYDYPEPKWITTSKKNIIL